MATEYKLSYTAEDIDKKLGKIDDAILSVSQNLSEEQKIVARENIGVAPADAIVDQSPITEFYNGRENYDNFASCWEWRKYIDGTFYLYIYGSFGGDIIEFPLEMTESLPFDVFEFDECSYAFELYDDENDEVIYLDGDGLLADFYIGSACEEDDVGGNLLVLYADIADDLREYITEHGLNHVWAYCDITITGKWR
jgi:hypothetical protein